MSTNPDPQIQTMIDYMPVKTGKTLQEWFQVLSSSGLEKHGELMKVLKVEYGLTHGFANMITLLYRQQAEGGSPPEEDLLAAQYSGPKAAMRPVFDAVLAAVGTLGQDVEIAPKKTYISLRRKKQFAILQVSSKERVDLGLNLKGVPAGGRLEGGQVFGGMCTHLVRLNSVEDVDAEVTAWLRSAYDRA